MDFVLKVCGVCDSDVQSFRFDINYAYKDAVQALFFQSKGIHASSSNITFEAHNNRVKPNEK